MNVNFNRGFRKGKETASIHKSDFANTILEETSPPLINNNEESSNESLTGTTDKSTTGNNNKSKVENNSKVIIEDNYTKLSSDSSVEETQTEYTFNNIVGGIDIFKAKVLELTDNGVFIKPLEGTYEKKSFNLISFEVNFDNKENENFPSLSEGDVIEIYYANIDLNVNPPMFEFINMN